MLSLSLVPSKMCYSQTDLSKPEAAPSEQGQIVTVLDFADLVVIMSIYCCNTKSAIENI